MERDETCRKLANFNKAMALHNSTAFRATAGRIQIVLNHAGTKIRNLDAKNWNSDASDKE